ncbi:hypothetical protein GCM10010431_63500 [Streptomyces kunmingensis]
MQGYVSGGAAGRVSVGQRTVDGNATGVVPGLHDGPAQEVSYDMCRLPVILLLVDGRGPVARDAYVSFVRASSP